MTVSEATHGEVVGARRVDPFLPAACKRRVLDQGIRVGARQVLAGNMSPAEPRQTVCGGADIGDRFNRSRRPDIMTRTFGVDLLNRSLLSDFLPVVLLML